MQSVLGRDQDAATSLTEAVRYFERDGDRQGQAVVLIDLGRLYYRLAESSASRALVPEPRPVDGEPADETRRRRTDGRGRDRGRRSSETGSRTEVEPPVVADADLVADQLDDIEGDTVVAGREHLAQG